MEQLEYNLLFRWFVGLSMDAHVWDVMVFSKNRDRLLREDVSRKVHPGQVFDLEPPSCPIPRWHFIRRGTITKPRSPSQNVLTPASRRALLCA
jgi:hypothetical protein